MANRLSRLGRTERLAGLGDVMPSRTPLALQSELPRAPKRSASELDTYAYGDYWLRRFRNAELNILL
jgi:hypothetical protein